ncbi:MAG: hypothetical protein AB7K09_12775 [Planctomycetota bacterium]
MNPPHLTEPHDAVEQLAAAHAAKGSGLATFRRAVDRELPSLPADVVAQLDRIYRRHQHAAIARRRRKTGLLLLPVALFLDVLLAVATVMVTTGVFDPFDVPAPPKMKAIIGLIFAALVFVVIGTNVVAVRMIRGKGVRRSIADDVIRSLSQH